MPFGYFKCLVLPMSVMPATDIFQSRMVGIFKSMAIKRKPNPYINDIFHSKGDSFSEHLEILDEILFRLGKAGMQANAAKSHFCALIVEFLGFELSRRGYNPLALRVTAIMKIMPLKTVRQVREFLGTINFVKNFVISRAALIAPLTQLTKKDRRFDWKKEQ
jgi:hypothetical protein